MNVTENRVIVPGWFWIVSVLALLWELVGIAAYLKQVTQTAAEVAALPPAQQALLSATPPWVTGAFAIAVFSGGLAATAMLLRRKWCRLFYAVSVVAAIAQFGWVFGVAKAHETIGQSAIYLPATVIAIGLLLVWLAGFAIKRGWLR